ncbi:MAG TPA: hypothetical protein VLK03_15095 [Nocardioides sp.]|nr:hypothetical protein [Nocardioides sp.]
MAPAPEHEPALAPTGRLLLGLLAFVVVAGVAGGALVWRTPADERKGGGPPDSSASSGWPAKGAARTLTEVRPDGVLEVTHWIHAARPLDAVQLALPRSVDPGSLVASAVEVTADGRPVSGRDRITTFGGSYVLDDATLVLVSYELTGAVELSSSAPGRGLVTTTAIDVSAGQVSERRVVRSEAVLSLACAASERGEAEPCGEREDDHQWSVQLGDREAGTRVMAVVTVPT